MKRCGEPFWQITEDICHALSGTRARHDDEAADAFLFEYGRLELVFEGLHAEKMLGVNEGKQALNGLQMAWICTHNGRGAF